MTAWFLGNWLNIAGILVFGYGCYLFGHRKEYLRGWNECCSERKAK